jgi:hypothetical protein
MGFQKGHSGNPGGKFQKGRSGNPGGRPKALRDVEELARLETTDAITTLATIHKDKKAPPSARVAAANALLDRGWGKPKQALENTGLDGGPMVHEVRWLESE